MAEWNKTKYMMRRLEERIYWKDGRPYYQGRPIIHRDSPIDGGVYLGSDPREAIVVDSKKYRAINQIYSLLLQRIHSFSYYSETQILREVYNITVNTFPKSSEEEVQKVLRKYNVGEDQKVALDVFIREGTGVCRHKALLAGVLLEKLIKDGYLKGKVSIDRNSDLRGGHAWVRYTSPRGKVYVLDASLHWLGLLEDGVKLGIWNYKRLNE